MQFNVSASALRSSVSEAAYTDTLTSGRELKWCGNCTQPVLVFLRGVQDKILCEFAGRDPATPLITAWAQVRCRKCDQCRYARRGLWTHRAMAESAIATRTWFGTLTLAPARRVVYLYKAHLEASRRRAEPWHKLSEAEQFGYIVKAIRPELQMFLKRIRKNSGASLRYLLVSEAHADGFPHFHILVHEREGAVTKRQLDAGWRDGFSQFRLLPVGAHQKAARYICKYLTKSALTKIIGSHKYGRDDEFISANAERLHNVVSTLLAERQ